MVSSIDTVVIGGGQSGLATAQQVQARGGDVLVLDEGAAIGDSWRNRWDSLVLFTPAERNGLPGMPFPATAGTFPTKDAVADYLAAYARRFAIPVRGGARVTSVERQDGRYALTARTATGSEHFRARNVVLATGGHRRPSVPALAESLAPAVHQMTSLDYRNAAPFAGKVVLVAGAAASGVQIAIELARTAKVHLAGRPTMHVPDPLLRWAPNAYWALLHHLLTRRTPIGRKAATRFHSRGGPLIRVSIDDASRSGVTLRPRVASAAEKRVTFEDGTSLQPDAVVWATGSTPDLDWIPSVPLGPGRAPITERGAVAGSPGLYTVGMPFQYGLTSGLIGGVGRDATWVAQRVTATGSRRFAGVPVSR